ncbi:MAG: ATP-binding protein [Candidatus Roizmanbacteria bacterium]|nr:ATP-binding protein [Candidatus Roizmanbacteria bacterium]
MTLQFRKAERAEAKLRLALISPSGFGKTYSALRIAKGLGGKVAMLDTENGSGDLFAEDFEYDILTMNAPYDPKKYIQAIESAEEAGYNILIIDSLTHAYSGSGGILSKHSAIAEKTGNSFNAWGKVMPLQNALMEKILASKLHIIATIRSKTDWIVENGKPKKVGLAPDQKTNIDYEFTCVLELDKDHNAHCSKDRTGLFDGQIMEATENIGKILNDWLHGKKITSNEPAIQHAEGSERGTKK